MKDPINYTAQEAIAEWTKNRGDESKSSQPPSTAIPKDKTLKAEPTPGPWRVVDEAPYLIFGQLRAPAIATVDYTTGPDRHEPLRGFLSSRQMMTDEEFRESEREGWQEKKEAEMRANARLIAAAPDLYAALKFAISVLNTANIAGSIYAPVLQQARRAIALVEGEKKQ